MSTSKEEILGRIRVATGAGTAPPAIARNYRHTDERPHEQLVALFCERVSDYRAEVERVSAAEIQAAVSAAASRHGARRLGVPPQLPHEWRVADLEMVADESLSPRELDALDGVVTGCTAAIAETGTLVLSAGPQEGRRVLSLVPDLHICVVGADQVVGTVPEAIAQLTPTVRDTHHPVTFISGPSATSDIELQRVEGVHGPRRLVVLVAGST